MTQKNRRFTLILALVCFITNLSQLPILVKNDLTHYLSYPSWALLIIILFISGMIKFAKMEMQILAIGMFFLFGVGVSTIFSSHNHFASNMIPPFYLSLFIILVGLFLSRILDKESIYYLAKAYVISIFIVSLNIYIEFFSSGITWDAVSYTYTSKNSASQMILTGFIFLYILYTPKGFLKVLLKWGILTFWLVLLAALQSRATILGLFIVVIIFLLSKGSTKRKIITIALVSIAVSVAMISPQINNIIIDNVLLGNRGTSSLDDISSGRVSQITVLFPLLIEGNELLGTATLYVENFILNSILKHGLLFGWVLIAVAIWPVVWGLKNLNKTDPINIVFIIIAIVYFINGIFEAQAPFGPGTKNYILWLLFGVLYGINRYKFRRL